MKKKEIKVFLTPEDFKDTYYSNCMNCPLARAARRHFNSDYALVDSSGVWMNGKTYMIKGKFDLNDHGYVKEQYEKHPKKDQYYVTLIEK